MEFITNLNSTINDIVWGPPMLILLVGTGVLLTFRLKALQFSNLIYAHKMIFKKNEDSEGDITNYQALTTALAATIGTGNIAGVATAIAAGGPGAVFWMWVTGLVGMATKYAEAVLAVKYRVKDKRGEMAGGPMYYIEKGLGMKWLAVLFAFFGAVAAFGIGNMVQANSVADAIYTTFGVQHWVTGLLLVIFTAVVLLGGIKSIGKVTALLVPIMAVFYVLGGSVVIIKNAALVPAAFASIFSDAFTGNAVAGGALGTVIRYGVARGVFSNEAGLGSAPIAAAAAKTDHPVRQALVSMTQTFIDTLVVCSFTALTILTSGLVGTINPATGEAYTGAALTTTAFNNTLPGVGGLIVAVGIIFFAYSTILGWSYYGEKCLEYLVGEKGVIFYRVAFVLFIMVGALSGLQFIWDLADTMNGLMALPNLIGLVGLSGIVVKETKDYMQNIKAKEEN
ncbi:MAG: sodium:alanine symporter family protein [Eubacteriales bacterium]|nr:sodium:alanine symporter family protein [Eubacteriales bacterium]